MELIIILIILVLIIFLVAPSFQRKPMVQRKYTHRGYHHVDQSIKENSLEAFEASVKRGYGIEFDVQLSKDGQVVVYHDDSLLRLEKLDQKVIDVDYAQLKSYQLPLLKDVLTLVNGQVDLIVELKSSSTNNKLLCQKVSEILLEYQGTYCIESFDPRIVGWFKRYQPQIMRGQLIQPVKLYEQRLIGLFINSLIYQFLTRPHFIALNVSSSKSHPMVRINQWLGAKTVLWVVRKPQQVHRSRVDAYIFEYFKA